MFIYNEVSMKEHEEELHVHRAKLAMGAFNVEDAKQIARSCASAELDDPFLYARTVSSLLANQNCPEDYMEQAKQGRKMRNKAVNIIATAATTWDQVIHNMQRLGTPFAEAMKVAI